MTNNSAGFRSRRSFLMSGYACLAATFLGLVALPYARATSRANADIQRLDQEIRTRRDKAQQLEDVERRIKLMRLETANFDRLVPANQDLGPFLAELYRELEKSGMSDSSVSAGQPTPLGKSQKLPIEVHGKGTFAQVHQFLTRIENLERMSSVGKLSIDADTDMNGYVTAQLTLFIYNTKPGS